VISLLSGKVPQKYKVKDGDIILIDKEYLLGMMDFVDSFIAKAGID
jgi:propanediol dehydratase large subunit